MKTKLEPPPELAPRDTVPAQESLLEILPEPPPELPPSSEQPHPVTPAEPFLRRN